MNKTLIILDEEIKFGDINKDKYRNFIFSYNINDIKREDINYVIYIGGCKRYNNSIENRSIVLVNEAFVKECNEDKRVLSSFSLNYYLNEASNELNKGISIVNILSSNSIDESLQDEMYNKYSCLVLDKNSYRVLSFSASLKKKASCLLRVVDKNESINSDELMEVVSQTSL